MLIAFLLASSIRHAISAGFTCVDVPVEADVAISTKLLEDSDFTNVCSSTSGISPISRNRLIRLEMHATDKLFWIAHFAMLRPLR